LGKAHVIDVLMSVPQTNLRAVYHALKCKFPQATGEPLKPFKLEP
jgi:hypothetical protein